jgi:hypothetical protein
MPLVCCLIWGIIPELTWERLRKITTIISVNVRQSDSYLNPENPDLEAVLQSPTKFSLPRLKFKSILLIAGRDLNLTPPEYKTGEVRQSEHTSLEVKEV